MKKIGSVHPLQIIRFCVQLLFMVFLILAIATPRPLYSFLFLIIIFAGVFSCGWLCPFGTLQNWMGTLGRVLKIKKYKTPLQIQRYLVLTRYFLYALFVLHITFPALDAVANFSKVFTSTLSVAALGILVFFVLISFFFDRPFCNYFCVYGARMGLFSIFRIFTFVRDEKKCIHCHLCDKKCPMNILVSQVKGVRHPNCIGCFNCLTTCPVNAIKYGFCPPKMSEGKQTLDKTQPVDTNF